MKPKTIAISILLALLAIILFNNKEEASFWLFGNIRTSKLIILAIFFILGVITGGLIFRRKRKHPKEYSISGESTTGEHHSESHQSDHNTGPDSNLSDADREYLSRD